MNKKKKTRTNKEQKSKIKTNFYSNPKQSIFKFNNSTNSKTKSLQIPNNQKQEQNNKQNNPSKSK